MPGSKEVSPVDKHKIQHALDTVLSGLQDDPFLAQRVMTQTKERK